jgi:hypothetical protein
MVFPILGGNSAVASYQIDNSLRFNDGDSPYLSRSFTSVTNTKKFTASFWFKPSQIPQSNFSGFLDVGGDNSFSLFTDSTIYFFEAGGNQFYWRPRMLFRDCSAWYHFVLACDSTLATQTDRVKMYVNGVRITSFHNNSGPSQNYDFAVNTTGNTRYIGQKLDQSSFYDGYLAEFYQIDGQQLEPTDFGEFDADSGIWKPIEYTGTFGSAGYYLDFENSGSLGADQSGNGNNFTPNNLASTDQTTDTPTNNFATLNPLSNGNWTLSEGNMKCNGPTAIEQLASTFAVSSGKWYWEAKTDGTTGANSIGITADTRLNVSGTDTYMYRDSNGRKRRGGVETSYGATFASTDVIGIALDMDGGTITFYKNNTSQGTAFSSISGTYSPSVSDLSSTGGRGFIVNFGQDSTFAGTETAQGNADGNGYGDFYYAPPSGYLALCTQNLATELSPTIDDGSQYFNTVLWTGNNSNPRTITGVGFQSDFAWTKCRTNGSHHKLYDSSRGLNIANTLNSSGSDAEYSSTNGGVSGSDSDGFIVNAGSSNDDAVNDSAFTYVAWNWKANAGSTSSNTDGSITSTVQANTTAGFSIATFTGNGLNAQTIGHGLSQPTELYIWKRRNSAGNWGVETTVIDGTADFLSLNSTDAKVDSGTAGQYLPTSTTQYISFAGAGLNSNGGTYVCYSFHSVEGYSKFGKYTGNGSSDGSFVFTSFRPHWIMIKKINGASQWVIHDTTRQEYNMNTKILQANNTSTESTTSNADLDILSNGFKLRSSDDAQNGSGDTYIYMAFAESPFVSSTAIPVTAR